MVIALMVLFGVCLAFALNTFDKIKNNNYPRTVEIKKGSDFIGMIAMGVLAGVTLTLAIIY